jgi:hypothetical protein
MEDVRDVRVVIGGEEKLFERTKGVVRNLYNESTGNFNFNAIWYF